jgi:hypothetical protein
MLWEDQSLVVDVTFPPPQRGFSYDLQLVISDKDFHAISLAELRAVHPMLDVFIDGAVSRPLDEGADSLQWSTSTIREWLERCKRFHTECLRGDNGFFPRRILFLEDQKSARVVERQSNLAPPYACLSHRWSCRTKEVALT